MASGSWVHSYFCGDTADDEDFEPDEAKEEVSTDKWEGEDEDDNDIKDNWDDEEDDTLKSDQTPVSQPKKKKPLTERIKEKQEKRRQEILAKEEEQRRLAEMEKELTPEEQLAEKLKNQRLQEESDLEIAKDAFGFSGVLPGQKTIDNFEPTNKEEFTELANMITKKLSKYETKLEYPTFLESMFRDLLIQVDPEDIKRISNTLNILASEKLKLSKSAKGGKKKAAKKSTLTAGKASRNDMAYDDSYYNEYDDFM